METTAAAAADFMPFGSGLGTFRQVYQLYEDHDRFDVTAVVNHAHDDYARARARDRDCRGRSVLLLFLAWWVRASWRAWTAPDADPYARAAVDRVGRDTDPQPGRFPASHRGDQHLFRDVPRAACPASPCPAAAAKDGSDAVADAPRRARLSRRPIAMIAGGPLQALSAGMMAWYEAKMFIEHAVFFTSDALHVLVGMVAWIVIAAVSRRPLSDWRPWLAVLVLLRAQRMRRPVGRALARPWRCNMANWPRTCC